MCLINKCLDAALMPPSRVVERSREDLVPGPEPHQVA